MKLLKWLFLVAGAVLILAGGYRFFYEEEISQNQIIGMFGVGILLVLAGSAIKSRKA